MSPPTSASNTVSGFTTSASRTGSSSRARGRTSSTLYTHKELVDVDAGMLLLASRAMHALLHPPTGSDADAVAAAATRSAQARAICNSVRLAQALGGYLPVRYYMHEAQEGFGRMRAAVMADGMNVLPFMMMMRNARAVLAAKYYWDVDMANCQPSLLAQQLARFSIPCPLLDRYVAHRGECIAEVMAATGAGRNAVKELFLRLMFFGGVRAWAQEHGLPEGRVPEWVLKMPTELRKAATALLATPSPTIAQLKDSHMKRPLAYADLSVSGGRLAGSRESDPLASIMAIYLQTLECECVRALVAAINGDCRAVGGIIYDGVLVEKLRDESALPSQLLRRWEFAVKSQTGFVVTLETKPLTWDMEWLEPAPAHEGGGAIAAEAWMDGHHLMRYDEVKALWEAHAFKVVRSGNYIRVDPVNGSRQIISDKQLIESYRHLHYADVEVLDSGGFKVTASHAFITRWIRDPLLRTYRDMVFLPPPLVAQPGAFNTWDGYAVQRYEPPANKPVDPDSTAVCTLIEFFHILCNRKPGITKYVLDWVAHIFQQPAKKPGIALLLKGEEGVGKNRATDLLRAMLGCSEMEGAGCSSSKFLQTASPASDLYGQYTSLREGKLLIVVNESNGSDNFAANDKIKDMITSDSFQCNGKYINAYPVRCFARFIFTTNNDNCIKVNPDSRRYMVIEVSSELRGNTAYFKRLSALIDDEHSRYEFYAHLMARNLSGIDWINDRPVTDYYLQMVAMNLPYEHQFFKQLVLDRYHSAHKRGCRGDDGSGTADGFQLKGKDLFAAFCTWLAEAFTGSDARYSTSETKFGTKMSKLSFKGVVRKRVGAGMLYTFHLPLLVQELTEKRWLAPDEAPNVPSTSPV